MGVWHTVWLYGCGAFRLCRVHDFCGVCGLYVVFVSCVVFVLYVVLMAWLAWGFCAVCMFCVVCACVFVGCCFVDFGRGSVGCLLKRAWHLLS